MSSLDYPPALVCPGATVWANQLRQALVALQDWADISVKHRERQDQYYLETLRSIERRLDTLDELMVEVTKRLAELTEKADTALRHESALDLELSTRVKHIEDSIQEIKKEEVANGESD